MGYLSVLLFGVGLSADAASVAICEGLKLKNKSLAPALKIALFFGAFQMLMPILGFYLGDLMRRIRPLEGAIGWIAFLLLLFVAVKMLIDAFGKREDSPCGCEAPACTKELLLLAVATSIDAMTVGVSFAAEVPALLPLGADLNVVFAAFLIGCVTFVLSLIAACVGGAIAGRLGNKAEIIGGVILLLLAAKTLLSNLGVDLAF